PRTRRMVGDCARRPGARSGENGLLPCARTRRAFLMRYMKTEAAFTALLLSSMMVSQAYAQAGAAEQRPRIRLSDGDAKPGAEAPVPAAEAPAEPANKPASPETTESGGGAGSADS